MTVTLDYGRTGLVATLPASATLLGLTPAPPLADPAAAVRAALAQPIGTAPLATLAAGRRDACIVICDFTRPVPNPLLLGEILPILMQAGIPIERVTVLIATGTHRASTPAEHEDLLGPWRTSGLRVVDHDCDDPTTNRFLGTSPRGLPIYLDTHWLDADLKLTVGLIEPHFMAGFSGGRKLVMPGVAGRETIQRWHSPAYLEHPAARNGVVDGNPVHAENTAIAALAPADLICDVTIDEQRRLTGVFAGHWQEAWRAGTAFVAQQVEASVPAPVAVALTSGGGYPLDATFYQVVKGIVGAFPIVAPGGTVIIAAAMQEGIGSAPFRQTLEAHADLPALVTRMSAPDWQPLPDQWQVEMLAKAQRQHRVIIVTTDPTRRAELAACHLETAATVEEALERAPAAPHALAVIPKGPYVIPVIARNG